LKIKEGISIFRVEYRNMKLSEYAKLNSITYRTAWSHWQSGKIKCHQLDTGTVVVEEPIKSLPQQIAIYARVSSSENKTNLDLQAERLQQYAMAKGYKIYKVIREIGSGLNDDRKKLNDLLKDKCYNILIVEHKDRLTRFGFNYLNILFEEQGKQIEVVNYEDNKKEDLIQDFVSVITSFCARLYGQRRTKRKTEQLIRELEQCN
jgi:predicted site-specific integrase-resolvase